MNRKMLYYYNVCGHVAHADTTLLHVEIGHKGNQNLCRSSKQKQNWAEHPPWCCRGTAAAAAAAAAGFNLLFLSIVLRLLTAELILQFVVIHARSSTDD